MYHPTRGGVRGGRDQFKWDDVKVDKHRENYLGHSVKAPVGRWQKGKDLFWYSKDKTSQGSDQDALKAEIQRVKKEEEQLMREALGLAPQRSNRPQGNRLDKQEFSELVKRGSTLEDLGAGHAEAAQVNGVGFARAPPVSDPLTSIQQCTSDVSAAAVPSSLAPQLSERMNREESDEEITRQKRKHEDRKHERHKDRKREKHEDRKHEGRKREKHEGRKKREKRRSQDSDDMKRRKDKEKRRHDSESD